MGRDRIAPEQITQGEDSIEWTIQFFDVFPGSLFAIHQADGPQDVQTRLAGTLDGLDRGVSGGADVIDNHNVKPARGVQTFQKFLKAMFLRLFSHQERVDRRAELQTLPSDRGDNRVSPHGEASHGRGAPAALDHFGDEQPAHQGHGGRPASRQLRVHVNTAALARYKNKIALADR